MNEMSSILEIKIHSRKRMWNETESGEPYYLRLDLYFESCHRVGTGQTSCLDLQQSQIRHHVSNPCIKDATYESVDEACSGRFIVQAGLYS